MRLGIKMERKTERTTGLKKSRTMHAPKMRLKLLLKGRADS